MTCLIDNTLIEVTQNPGAFLTAISDARTSEKKEVKNDSFREFKPRPGLVSINLKPEQYIAFQMSHISEQKGIFVFCDQGVYYITVIVDNRDLALNRRIFEREREIMHFYRQFKFDLTVIPLENRQLADVLTPKGTRIL